MDYLARILSFLTSQRNDTTQIDEPSNTERPFTWRPPGSNTQLSLSYADLCIARALLQTKLPTELVLQILNYAEYWPSHIFEMQHKCDVRAYSGSSHGKVCLDVDVVPDKVKKIFRGENVRVKAVEFTITSRDQGWTSEDCKGRSPGDSWGTGGG